MYNLTLYKIITIHFHGTQIDDNIAYRVFYVTFFQITKIITFGENFMKHITVNSVRGKTFLFNNLFIFQTMVQVMKSLHLNYKA